MSSEWAIRLFFVTDLQLCLYKGSHLTVSFILCKTLPINVKVSSEELRERLSLMDRPSKGYEMISAVLKIYTKQFAALLKPFLPSDPIINQKGILEAFY